MFTAFNLGRLMNIIDKNVFKEFLREPASLYFVKPALLQQFAVLRRLYLPSPKICFVQIKTAA
jgi:hypothetical protein